MMQRERMAGIRFSQLIRQLVDDGWTLTAIGDAIGCHQTLISKWHAPWSERPDRKGINNAVIQGIYDGLGVSADYLFMRVPKGYHNRIRLKNGGEWEAEKHEIDHKDFKIASKTDLEVEMLSAKREREQM